MDTKKSVKPKTIKEQVDLLQFDVEAIQRDIEELRRSRKSNEGSLSSSPSTEALSKQSSSPSSFSFLKFATGKKKTMKDEYNKLRKSEGLEFQSPEANTSPIVKSPSLPSPTTSEYKAGNKKLEEQLLKKLEKVADRLERKLKECQRRIEKSGSKSEGLEEIVEDEENDEDRNDSDDKEEEESSATTTDVEEWLDKRSSGRSTGLSSSPSLSDLLSRSTSFDRLEDLIREKTDLEEKVKILRKEVKVIKRKHRACRRYNSLHQMLGEEGQQKTKLEEENAELTKKISSYEKKIEAERKKMEGNPMKNGTTSNGPQQGDQESELQKVKEELEDVINQLEQKLKEEIAKRSELEKQNSSLAKAERRLQNQLDLLTDKQEKLTELILESKGQVNKVRDVLAAVSGKIAEGGFLTESNSDLDFSDDTTSLSESTSASEINGLSSSPSSSNPMSAAVASKLLNRGSPNPKVMFRSLSSSEMTEAPKKSTKKLLQMLGAHGEDELVVAIDMSQQNSYFEDDSGELIFNDRKRMHVRGGTVPRLIDLLVDEKSKDEEFLRSFLTTFPSFTDTSTLLRHLKQMSFPETTEDEGLVKERRKKLATVLRFWAENLPAEFPKSDETLERVFELIELLHKNGMEMVASTLKGSLAAIRIPKTVGFTEEPPKPVVPKSNDFMDFDPMEFARQMALIEFNLYKGILSKELLGGAWNKSMKEVKSPNVSVVIQRFNLMSGWVQTEIVKQEKIRERCAVIKQMIKVAKCCYAINNFNGVMEILSGLSGSAIGRLKKTWLKLEIESPKSISTYKWLCGQMDNSENYKVMKSRLLEITPPCLPYLGAYLTELSMVEEGNPNQIEERPNLVNFAKRKRLAFVIKEALQFQHQAYNFVSETKILTFLKQADKLNEEAIFKLSMICEPRDEKKGKRPSTPTSTRKASSTHN